MSDIFDSLKDKVGLDKEGVIDKVSGLLDQHRDQIPDSIEGKIDEALHGDMVGGLLDRIGLGGHHEEAAAEEEAPAEEEEATEEEEPAEEEEASEEEEEAPAEEEEATEEEESAEEEEATEEESEEEEPAEEEAQ